MFYVYLIRSINHSTRLYSGFSTNVSQRLKDHNSGKSVHTNKYKPWQLEACFVFRKKKTALDFERYLKSPSGRAFRNKRLI